MTNSVHSKASVEQWLPTCPKDECTHAQPPCGEAWFSSGVNENFLLWNLPFLKKGDGSEKAVASDVGNLTVATVANKLDVVCHIC